MKKKIEKQPDIENQDEFSLEEEPSPQVNDEKIKAMKPMKAVLQ